MSYVVRHRTQWDDQELGEDAMHRMIAQKMGTTPDHAEDIMIGSVREDWRSREEHLREVSQNRPGTLITVDCEGEDGLRWVEYYRDGKTYSLNCTRPEFDEKLLE